MIAKKNRRYKTSNIHMRYLEEWILEGVKRKPNVDDVVEVFDRINQKDQNDVDDSVVETETVYDEDDENEVTPVTYEEIVEAYDETVKRYSMDMASDILRRYRDPLNTVRTTDLNPGFVRLQFDVFACMSPSDIQATKATKYLVIVGYITSFGEIKYTDANVIRISYKRCVWKSRKLMNRKFNQKARLSNQHMVGQICHGDELNLSSLINDHVIASQLCDGRHVITYRQMYSNIPEFEILDTLTDEIDKATKER